MSKNRHGGRQQRSHGGTAGGGGGGNKQGKISYNSGEEPAFIRQFKARTGYQAPLTTEDKRQMMNDNDERPRDGDYRKDDEKPQIVQLNANDLSKEEVEIELTKAKEGIALAEILRRHKKTLNFLKITPMKKRYRSLDDHLNLTEEEKQCIDSSGRLLFRKPKEKSDESDIPPPKSEIIEVASTKTTKRKNPNPTASKEIDPGNSIEPKKTKRQLLSFMNESGIDGDD